MAGYDDIPGFDPDSEDPFGPVDAGEEVEDTPETQLSERASGWFEFRKAWTEISAAVLSALRSGDADAEVVSADEELDGARFGLKDKILRLLEWRREDKKWYFVDRTVEPPVSRVARLDEFSEDMWNEVEQDGVRWKKAKKHLDKAWNAALGWKRYANTTRWWDSGDVKLPFGLNIPWFEIGDRIPVTGDMITMIPGLDPVSAAVPAISFGRNSLRAGLGIGAHFRAIRNQLSDAGLGLLKYTVVGAPADALYDSMTFSLEDFRSNTLARLAVLEDFGLLPEDVGSYRRGLLGRSVEGLVAAAFASEDAAVHTRTVKRRLLETFGIGGGIGKAAQAAAVAQKLGGKSEAKNSLLDRLYPGTESGELAEARAQLEAEGFDEDGLNDWLGRQIQVGYITSQQLPRLQSMSPIELHQWLQVNEELQLRIDILLEQNRIQFDLADRIRRLPHESALRALATVEGNV